MRGASIERPLRIVSDTNIAVSAALNISSIPARAFARMLAEDSALLSAAMISEIVEVFHREKFDRFLSLESRLLFLNRYLKFALLVDSLYVVKDCVDPKDNIILECALSGNADIILTGDDHLLRLNPWRGIPIIKPADYLARQPGEGLP